jgi:hypothetical protein
MDRDHELPVGPDGTIDAGCNDLFSQASHKGRVENFFVPFGDLV